MSAPVVRAEGLGKRYVLRSAVHEETRPETAASAFAQGVRRFLRGRADTAPTEDLWAVKDISFDLHEGEVLGIVGANGAGKSTLLKILSRVTDPTEGRAELHGRVGALLEVGTGFHGDLTGRDNIYLNGAILGMKRTEIQAKFDEIVEFAGIGRFLETPVKRYSSGMYVRLAFAVAAHLEPEILIVDEVLSVGDQAFQEKCLGRMQEVTQSGRTVLFVSHNMASVSSLCTRGILIQGGRLTFDGPIDQTIESYLAGRRRLEGSGSLEGLERDGTGRLQFADVELLGPGDGPDVFAGRDLTIRMTLRGEPVPGQQLNFGIGINNQLGARLATLYTRFDPAQEVKRTTVGDETVITCRVPNLNIRPARYLLTLYLDRAGEVLDRIQNQIELNLLPSDYFGTGTLPAENQGPVMLEQEWRVPEAGTRGPDIALSETSS